MSNIKRRKFSAPFKAKVALEIIKDKEPASVICSKHSIHPAQASQWKDNALKSMTAGFDNKPAIEAKKKDDLIDELYKQVGQLKVELDWLKKNMGIAQERASSIY
jgi:putative transposase